MKKINPIVRWWVTPELPPEDIFAKHNFLSQWLIHPIKRRLARHYLRLLQKFTDIKVIAITGSTGKTTTTEILASILKTVDKTVWSSEGIDPVYNIPNTILRTSWGTRYLVLEMSVEYLNEMNYYLWLVKPDVGIITNIATTHTQFLKTKEGVAAEKSKLIKVLSETGVAVLNVEDSLVKSFSKNTKAKICWYGEGSEIYAKNVKLNQDLSTSFTLYINKNKKYVHMNAFGKQFVNNAIASSAAAFSLGVNLENIVKGIQIFKLSPHRLNIFRTVSNGIIFDDSYNSNPKAANESLDTFNCLAGAKTKIAVIGDMLELGKFEESSHKELGKKISKMDFEYLICVGSATRFVLEEASKVIGENKCFLTTNWSEALGIIKPLLGHDTALFVKGSRSIYLDKLVHSLT